MYKKLEDCDVNDFVVLWCIGINKWDDDSVQIIDKGILITVKYRNGTIGRFSSSTECKTVTF